MDCQHLRPVSAVDTSELSKKRIFFILGPWVPPTWHSRQDRGGSLTGTRSSITARDSGSLIVDGCVQISLT